MTHAVTLRSSPSSKPQSKFRFVVRAKRYNTVFLGSQQLSLVDYFCRLMLLLNYSYLNEVSPDSYCYIESKAPKVSPTYESLKHLYRGSVQLFISFRWGVTNGG